MQHKSTVLDSRMEIAETLTQSNGVADFVEVKTEPQPETTNAANSTDSSPSPISSSVSVSSSPSPASLDKDNNNRVQSTKQTETIVEEEALDDADDVNRSIGTFLFVIRPFVTFSASNYKTRTEQNNRSSR